MALRLVLAILTASPSSKTFDALLNLGEDVTHGGQVRRAQMPGKLVQQRFERGTISLYEGGNVVLVEPARPKLPWR